MKILKFSATWCNPCKMLSKTLDGMELPYELVEIDIEEAPMLAQRHLIRGVPTMVLVDEDENEIRRKVGVHNSAAILEWLGEVNA